jgi:hypothetical protein
MDRVGQLRPPPDREAVESSWGVTSQRSPTTAGMGPGPHARRSPAEAGRGRRSRPEIQKAPGGPAVPQLRPARSGTLKMGDGVAVRPLCGARRVGSMRHAQ